jgi:hypothetical protein
MATINHKTYNEATETFKDFSVYDGKETLIFKVDGSEGNVGTIGTGGNGDQLLFRVRDSLKFHLQTIQTYGRQFGLMKRIMILFFMQHQDVKQQSTLMPPSVFASPQLAT